MNQFITEGFQGWCLLFRKGIKSLDVKGALEDNARARRELSKEIDRINTLLEEVRSLNEANDRFYVKTREGK